MAFPINISIIGTDVDYTLGSYPTVTTLSGLTGYTKFDAVAYYIKQLPQIELDERLGVNKKKVTLGYEIECKPLNYPTVLTDSEVFFGIKALQKNYLFLQYDNYIFKLFGVIAVTDGGTVKVELGDSYNIEVSDGTYKLTFTLIKRL